MTAMKVVILKCDGCGTTALSPTLIILDLINMVRLPTHAGEARTLAHAKGWRHTKSGKDLCPPCQSTKRSPSKIHLGLHGFHFRHHADS